MSKGWALLGLAALVLPIPAPAALPGRYLRFEHLIPEAGGAPVTGISSILQDRGGRLWFGTVAGLAGYDGRRFRFFSPPSGAATVFPVIEDRRGDVWFGTSGRGLFRFEKDAGAFVQYRHDPSDPASLGDDNVLALQEDSGGTLWIGTRLRGLYRFDRAKGAIARTPLDPGAGAVWDLLVDRRGFLWAGTQEGGLYRRNPDSGEIVNFRFDAADPRSLGSNTVWSIFQDGEGTIWAGTRGGGLCRYVSDPEGFVRFSGAEPQPRDLLSPAITALAEDDEGRLWIGTSWSGLRIWNRKTGEYVVLKHDVQDADSITDDNITSIFKDSSGIMWVGTARGGIQKCQAGLAKFSHHKHDRFDPRSFSRSEVRALETDGRGRLWIGFDEGLDEIEERSGRIRRYRNDPSDGGSLSPGGIVALALDGQGRLWIGTESRGLDCLDPRTGRLEHVSSDPRNPSTLSDNRVHAIRRDRTDPGVLWIGTQRGLNRLDTRTRRFVRYLHDPADSASLSGNIVTAMEDGGPGVLWVGTSWGLNRLDRASERFERFVGRFDAQAGGGPNSNAVNCLYRDGAGILWAGTDGGLNRFDPVRRAWSYAAEKEGLPGSVICGILEDASGRLWLSTNRGLARFDPRAGRSANFGLHDGVQDNQFLPRACLKSADGRMFFGGVNGLNEVRPEEVKVRPYVPPLAWTGFYRNGQEMKIGELPTADRPLELSSRANAYAFEFAVLHYLRPELNRLAFKLEPRDREWMELGAAGLVSLSGLKPGGYRLRIKGATPDGVWNERGLELELRLVRPFWSSPWFLAPLLLFAVSGVVLGVRMWKKLKSSFLLVGDKADAIIEAYDLTGREQEILRLILQGSSNKDIEKKLFISGSTVRNHVYNIYQKLGVKNRLELINLIGRDAQKKIP